MPYSPLNFSYKQDLRCALCVSISVRGKVPEMDTVISAQGKGSGGASSINRNQRRDFNLQVVAVIDLGSSESPF